MGIVNGTQVYKIITKVLEIMNKEILEHGRYVSYIFYNMLRATGRYTEKDLADFSMLGLLHDIGIIKTGYKSSLVEMETKDTWAHSIYGHLFLKYLSPAGDKADVILYHHLDYDKHSMMQSRYIKEASYLYLADKMEMFVRYNRIRKNMTSTPANDMLKQMFDGDYFRTNKNKKFSEDALNLFYKAEAKFNMMEKFQTGEYLDELEEIGYKTSFTDDEIKRYLQLIVYCIDFRSQQTVLHAMGTTLFAECVGRMMGIKGEELEKLYFGALLHDIGKIAIPLKILEAPRRLTDEEMRIMKAHVMITDVILSDIMNKDITRIAANHHEKIDGSGYPKGLKGEELTVSDRVMAVADILSALYGKRSYKDSMPKDKIISILSEDAAAGKLCPRVVEATVKHYDNIMSYYDRQMEEKQKHYLMIVEQFKSTYAKFKRFE